MAPMRRRTGVGYCLLLLASLACGSWSMVARAAEPLPQLAIDRSQVSVSGVSSGGYMATQMLVAHSATIMGVGVLAAGPWFCAGTSFPWNAVTVFARCMNLPDLLPFLGAPDIAPMVEETRTQARAGRIDDPAHLADARVYLFSGTDDALVPRAVVDALKAYYLHFISPEHIRYETGINANHAMITAGFGNPCTAFAAPFLNNCQYDAAGNLLQQIYGPLTPPAEARGSFVAFDQRPYFAPQQAVGLAEEGYAYIPQACRAGGCRLHVAFHGCGQSAAQIGDAFYRHAGYNQWAEANRIVVLYPQTSAITTRVLGRTLPWPNPQACWDWWGFTGNDYYLQSAPQIRAVAAMIERLEAKN